MRTIEYKAGKVRYVNRQVRECTFMMTPPVKRKDIQMRSLFKTNVVKFMMSVAVALLLSMALMGTVGTVHAATSGGNASQLITRITIGLNADCSSVPNTPQAHAILTQHHLCGYGKSGPDTIVYGNCGSLSIYLYDHGGGYLQWRGEITSSLGPFVNAQYNGDLDNDTTGQFGSVSRNSGVVFTSDWLDIFPRYTPHSQMYGDIYFAKDLLWWGLTCTSNGYVWSSVYVR